MNVKMIVTVPLMIISLLCGVYCPPTEENDEEFPSRYSLESCESNCENLRLYLPGSSFEIVRSARNPRKYCLIQTYLGSTFDYCFKKGDVEFLAMDDAELTLIIHPFDDLTITWDVTCKFPSFAQARKFYKDMTHDLPAEKVRFVSADYLIKSDHIELGTGTELILSMDSFLDYTTITVTKDDDVDDDDPVFIFPTDAVTDITQSAPTEISLSIRLNPGQDVLYKFGFMNEPLTSFCRIILHKLCNHIVAEPSLVNHRWSDNPIHQRLYDRVENLLKLRLSYNRERLSALLGEASRGSSGARGEGTSEARGEGTSEARGEGTSEARGEGASEAHEKGAQ